MKKYWLIVNLHSGSYDAALCDQVETLLQQAGDRLDRCIRFPDENLPSAGEARAADVDVIAVMAGDGTINSAVTRLSEWDGTLLVLPGGTMNLLSKKLHGDTDALTIVRAVTQGAARECCVPEIAVAGQRALVGVIAGPTTAWGDVREELRHRNIEGLTKAVPEALSKTLKGDGVQMAGEEQPFQAIYVEPDGEALAVMGILAENAGDILKHGWAWLSGDFRAGPSVTLDHRKEVMVSGSGDIGLLIDGEKAQAESPCTMRHVMGEARFLRTLLDEDKPGQ